MATYLLKRTLLIIPTLFGIMLISFAIIQFAPGGPIERVIAQISGTDVSATARIGGSQGDTLSPSSQSQAGPGEVSFTPAPDFFGTTSFSYTASDGNGGAATGVVTAVSSGSVGLAPSASGSVETVPPTGASAPVVSPRRQSAPREIV